MVIAKADRIGVAAVSMWELALLVEKGRLSLDRELLEWIRDALGQACVELLPMTPAVVATAHQLRGALGDGSSRSNGGRTRRSIGRSLKA